MGPVWRVTWRLISTHVRFARTFPCGRPFAGLRFWGSVIGLLQEIAFRSQAAEEAAPPQQQPWLGTPTQLRARHGVFRVHPLPGFNDQCTAQRRGASQQPGSRPAGEPASTGRRCRELTVCRRHAPLRRRDHGACLGPLPRHAAAARRGGCGPQAAVQRRRSPVFLQRPRLRGSRRCPRTLAPQVTLAAGTAAPCASQRGKRTRERPAGWRVLKGGTSHAHGAPLSCPLPFTA